MTSAPLSLAQHWDILWIAFVGLIVVVIGLLGFVNSLIWKSVVKPFKESLENLTGSISKLAEKFEGFVKDCAKCRLDMEKEFAKDDDFQNWRPGRDVLRQELYKALDKHTHDNTTGKTVRN